MRNSTINTVDVPNVGSLKPATLYAADVTPIRIIARNVGPAILFLAYDSADLTNQSPGLAATFQLPPGTSEVFILAPKQGLYATSVGGGGLISVAVSEAFPEMKGP